MTESKSASNSNTAEGADPGGKRALAKVTLEDLGENPVDVVLTQHWSAPGKPEENLIPGTEVRAHSDLAASLVNGGYAKLKSDSKK